MKEKVNTHFSFPLRLDMTPYTEDFLMGKSDRKEGMLHKLNSASFASFSCTTSCMHNISKQFILNK